MTTTQTMDIRELNAAELDAVAGALQIGLDLGLGQVHLSITRDGIAGSARAFGGGWYGGSIFFEDLVVTRAQ
jgi:hypothetical protein